jgi:glyoxylase-like metal-dependent hydrolase (beta-lactamase superfamily II)
MSSLPASMHFIERDWLSCNQLMLFDDNGATLIDTGYIKHSPLTVELVRRILSARGATLKRIINTHLHSDHCGGNAALVEAFGCPIWVPAAEGDSVSRWDPHRLSFLATGQRCDRFSAAGVVAPGDKLTLGGATWIALAAPGHDPHSLIFHCPEHRLLISADALWENGFGVIFPELTGEPGFAEQQAVLELIAMLDVGLVIPGHGPMFTDVEGALARARRRLDAFRADPARNARNALKVLLKFLLLDREQIRMTDLMAHAESASLMNDAAAFLHLPLQQAVQSSVADLVAQSVIRRDGDWLHNV